MKINKSLDSQILVNAYIGALITITVWPLVFELFANRK